MRLFQVCCVRSPQQLYALLSPTQQLFYDPNPPSLGTRLIALVTLADGMLMISVVSLLGVLRFLSIRFPFWFRIHTGYAFLCKVITVIFRKAIRFINQTPLPAPSNLPPPSTSVF